jgi:hypothetical protein
VIAHLSATTYKIQTRVTCLVAVTRQWPYTDVFDTA